MESDVIASVVLRALTVAKDLGDRFDAITESGAYASALLLTSKDLPSDSQERGLFLVRLDGWVLDLILDNDQFDANDLVDSVEQIARDHAKYQNCSLDKALSALDKVDS
jgi:hypothetical protein